MGIRSEMNCVRFRVIHQATAHQRHQPRLHWTSQAPILLLMLRRISVSPPAVDPSPEATRVNFTRPNWQRTTQGMKAFHSRPGTPEGIPNDSLTWDNANYGHCTIYRIVAADSQTQQANNPIKIESEKL